MTQLLVEMDEKVKKQFKMAATEDDTSMAELVRNFIKKYLAEKTKTVVY